MAMPMAMPPTWLTVVALIFLGLGFLCAGVILYDVFGRGYRQRTKAMEAVWPITAIYFGPLALLAYFRWGRPQSREWQEKQGERPLGREGSGLGLQAVAGPDLLHLDCARKVAHRFAALLASC